MLAYSYTQHTSIHNTTLLHYLTALHNPTTQPHTTQPQITQPNTTQPHTTQPLRTHNPTLQNSTLHDPSQHTTPPYTTPHYTTLHYTTPPYTQPHPTQLMASFHYDWPTHRLLAYSSLRVLLVPAMMLCALPRQQPVLSRDGFAMTCSLALGLSNGYFGSVPMILAPGKVPAAHKELTGL